MHSFWATEAERSFLQAAALDPEAPMPHWGIAMVAHGEFRPRFQLEGDGPSKRRKSYEGAAKRAFEAARKARELSAVPGKATPLEKLYIEAVAARLDLASKDPNAGYIQGLRAILAQYPGEVEAKSYLALHLMRGFETPTKTPRAGSLEAVALLRELVKEAPDHPGAAPLCDSRFRRFHVRQRRLAELCALCGTGSQHSPRAAHARTHLCADRQVGGSSEIL